MKRYRLNKEARRLSRLGVEIWLPLPGHKGFYEISNLGRVRALERTIVILLSAIYLIAKCVFILLAIAFVIKALRR